MMGIQDDEDEEALRGDTERLLSPPIDGAQYPVLATVLAGPNAMALRRELMELFAPQLRARAPRRAVRAICRLEGPGYNEPILVKDISATGVRFLVQTDVALDLTQFADMRLHLRISSGARMLPVALVRRCGGDQRHTDLACRFVAPTPDHGQVVAEIRSKIFGDEPAPSSSVG
jgi:hypothetical protein